MRHKCSKTGCLYGSSNAALESLCEKYEFFLIKVATALSKNVDVAEDAVHDFFLSFVASAERLRINGNLKTYLAVCVANLTRGGLRRKKPGPVRLDTDIEVV